MSGAGWMVDVDVSTRFLSIQFLDPKSLEFFGPSTMMFGRG